MENECGKWKVEEGKDREEQRNFKLFWLKYHRGRERKTYLGCQTGKDFYAGQRCVCVWKFLTIRFVYYNSTTEGVEFFFFFFRDRSTLHVQENFHCTTNISKMSNFGYNRFEKVSKNLQIVWLKIFLTIFSICLLYSEGVTAANRRRSKTQECTKKLK